MRYLSIAASRHYLETTKGIFHYGALSWTHYLERMVALRLLTMPEDPSHSYAHRVLSVEEWQIEAEWPDQGRGGVEGAEPASDRQSFRVGLCQDNRGYYEFLSRVRGLKDWVFHQYDDDFHPSIPHGHFQGRNQPKLDAYLGWVYQGAKQIERKPRKVIVELWNDDEFRTFASIAIDYYVREFPRYRWRVAHPRRLPKKS